MSLSPKAHVSFRRMVGTSGITPRLILSWEGQDSSEPSRIYSDATGEGKLVHGRWRAQCAGCHNQYDCFCGQRSCLRSSFDRNSEALSCEALRTLDGESADRGKPCEPPPQRPRALIRNRACRRARLSYRTSYPRTIFRGWRFSAQSGLFASSGKPYSFLAKSEPWRMCAPSLTKSLSPVLRAAFASA